MQREFDQLRSQLEAERQVLLKALQTDGGGNSNQADDGSPSKQRSGGIKGSSSGATKYTSTAFTTMSLYDNERTRMKETIDAHLLLVVQEVKAVQERLYREVDRLVEQRIASIRALNDRFRTVTAVLKQTTDEEENSTWAPSGDVLVEADDVLIPPRTAATTAAISTMNLSDLSPIRSNANNSGSINSSTATSARPKGNVSSHSMSFFASHYLTSKRSAFSKFSPSYSVGATVASASPQARRDLNSTMDEMEHSLAILRRVKAEGDLLPSTAKTLLERLNKVVETNKESYELHLTGLSTAEFFGRSVADEEAARKKVDEVECGGFKLHLHSQWSSLDLAAIHVSDTSVPTKCSLFSRGSPQRSRSGGGLGRESHRQIQTPTV